MAFATVAEVQQWLLLGLELACFAGLLFLYNMMKLYACDVHALD